MVTIVLTNVTLTTLTILKHTNRKTLTTYFI